MAESSVYPDARSRGDLRSDPGSGTTGGWFECVLSMTVDFASETASGRFGSTGRVEDAGPATCRYTVAGSKLEGVLALEGRSGSLRLASTCTETFNSALAADVEGDVAIVDGNGAYASLTGAGRLIGCLVYDASLHGFSLDATCRVLM